MGIGWTMTGSVRDEIWAQKGISRQRKYVDLIPPTIFLVIWKKWNKRAFKRIDDVEVFGLFF